MEGCNYETPGHLSATMGSLKKGLAGFVPVSIIHLWIMLEEEIATKGFFLQLQLPPPQAGKKTSGQKTV